MIRPMLLASALTHPLAIKSENFLGDNAFRFKYDYLVAIALTHDDAVSASRVKLFRIHLVPSSAIFLAWLWPTTPIVSILPAHIHNGLDHATSVGICRDRFRACSLWREREVDSSPAQTSSADVEVRGHNLLANFWASLMVNRHELMRSAAPVGGVP